MYIKHDMYPVQLRIIGKKQDHDNFAYTYCVCYETKEKKRKMAKRVSDVKPGLYSGISVINLKSQRFTKSYDLQ